MSQRRTALLMGLSVGLVACASSPVPVSTEPVVVYAAGSLRDALSEVARTYESHSGQKLSLIFGPSGLLRERIERGEVAHVFASADTQHPQRLADAGGWQTPRVLVRNGLCALTQTDVETSTAQLLETLLRPDIRIGMSTPRADPSGDYALALFAKADLVRPGSRETLERKALQLTGGPTSAAPPPGRNPYAWVLEQGRSDVFLTYCTNALAARADLPSLRVVQVPSDLQVGAAYGLTVRKGAPVQAERFARALLEPSAKAILAGHGFLAP
jgi:molybdate transport system substrate-binding protein